MHGRWQPVASRRCLWCVCAQVVIYDAGSGRVQQSFDLSGEEQPPDFASGAASPGGDAMVFGSSHRLHMFTYSSQAGAWQAAGTKQVRSSLGDQPWL